MHENCRWALVLKLANGASFNLTGLSNVLTKIWNVENKVKFKELADNMALAEFRYERDSIRIKEGGPWLCLKTTVLMHDWCPDLMPEEFQMKKLGVWAQMHNLPIGAVLNDKDVGEKLAAKIGKFIRVSQSETEENKRRYLRVRVELDVNEPVVNSFLLTQRNKDPLRISVKYERFPSCYERCGRLSHETEVESKKMEKRKTIITDLRRDELTCIFIIVAQSGAAELARMMAVCRLFSEVGKSEDVLRALNFDGFEVSVDNITNYQQINGLISLAEEAGHSVAQYIFAKIIMLSCCKLRLRPEQSYSLYRVALEKSVWIPRIYLPWYKIEDQTFMSQINSKLSCNSKDLYHYRLVRMFLSQCSQCEFKAMNDHLNYYIAYCRKVSAKSSHGILEFKYDGELFRPTLGANQHPEVVIFIVVCTEQSVFPRDEVFASFEEFRSQALQDLDYVFILNNETTILS